MVGKKIAKYRKACGMTQEQLAGALNVTQSAVSQWETEKTLPDIQQLFSVARFFDVSVEDLQGSEEQKPLEKTTQDNKDILFLTRNGEPISPEKRKKAIELLRIMMEEMDDDELDRAYKVIEIYRK